MLVDSMVAVHAVACGKQKLEKCQQLTVGAEHGCPAAWPQSTKALFPSLF